MGSWNETPLVVVLSQRIAQIVPGALAYQERFVLSVCDHCSQRFACCLWSIIESPLGRAQDKAFHDHRQQKQTCDKILQCKSLDVFLFQMNEA